MRQCRTDCGSRARSSPRLVRAIRWGWQVSLYITARGLGTSPVPVGNEILEIEFVLITVSLQSAIGPNGGIVLSQAARRA